MFNRQKYLKQYWTKQVGVKCDLCLVAYKVRKQTSYIKNRQRLCKDCTSKILSERNIESIGSLNPNWKGGRTSEIQKFYNSSEWKELRTQVFIRDNYTCRDCNKRGGQLEANHIKPRSRFPELALNIHNIETLCIICHRKKKWIVYDVSKNHL